MTLTAEPATLPQQMTWQRADGRQPTNPPNDPYPFNRCDGDLNLEVAVWRQGVIVSCDDEALEIGWAWLDPVTKRAELRWPLPPGDPISRTRGLIPGPNDQLAIVFERELHVDISLGIPEPHGWARVPESLGNVRYRAAAWVGPALEVVVTPSTADDEYGFRQAPKILAFAGGRRTERTVLPCTGEACPSRRIAFRAGGRWVFEGGGIASTEAGEATASVAPEHHEDFDLDLLAHGKLDVPTKLALGQEGAVIDADGKRVPSPLPWSELQEARLVRQNRYVIDGRITRQPLWAADRHYRTLVEQVGGRTLRWDTDNHDLVRISDDPGGRVSTKAVVRWPQALAKRIIYPDPAGGYWMVGTSGEHLHLDAMLHRTDQLSLRDHLRQRGSLLRQLDENEHERALGWALFGLPLLLAGAYLVGVFTGPRTSWRPRVTTPIVIAAGVYALTGFWAISAVLPLLR